MGVQTATVTRVDGSAVYVEIRAVAPGREFGPCQCVYLDPAAADTVVVAPLGGTSDEWVVIGLLA